VSSMATPLATTATYPVDVHVDPALSDRNRLTTFFRLILAIPHLLLVGGPAASVWWNSGRGGGGAYGSSVATGVLGAVAGVVAFIAWFAILFTGHYPEGLWNLVAFYLRWRVRAMAYIALLRDEYPPFGDGEYPASLEMRRPEGPRNRLTVFFRLLLAIPHLIAISILGVAWCVVTIIAWFAILFTGRYPSGMFDFSVGVLRWSTRVEAYLLLLQDEYPPFAFE
jgi:uncharacterized protein DUF4389